MNVIYINKTILMQIIYNIRIRHTIIILPSWTLTHTMDGDIILTQDVERSSKFMERNSHVNHVSEHKIIQIQGIYNI
jgi:hypothetical protein